MNMSQTTAEIRIYNLKVLAVLNLILHEILLPRNENFTETLTLSRVPGPKGRGTYTAGSAGTVNYVSLLKWVGKASIFRPTFDENAPNCTDLRLYLQKNFHG